MRERYIGTLGEFEQLVLLALMRLEGDGYGVSVQAEIESRTGRDASLGAVYKALQRLEEKGLIAGRMGEPTPERGGRRKRYFRLLPLGHQALEATLRALRRLTEGTSLEPARSSR